jgi:Fanconi anemia group M protein
MTPEKKAIIICDERERGGIVGMLKENDVEVQVKTLEVADFILSERCAAERKTRSDFESSIIDGRLFAQARAMAENFERPVIVVEGEADFESRISREALLGAYSSLITDFGIPLFFTRSTNATAELLCALAKHEQIAKKTPMRVFARRKALTLASQQRAIIESLPNVGPTMAKKLLEYFYSVENVITAPEKELQEVDKMGEKKAKEIRKLVSGRYKKEEDALEKD